VLDVSVSGTTGVVAAVGGVIWAAITVVLAFLIGRAKGSDARSRSRVAFVAAFSLALVGGVVIALVAALVGGGE
jgi:hypothetical protein